MLLEYQLLLLDVGVYSVSVKNLYYGLFRASIKGQNMEFIPHALVVFLG